MENKCFAKKHTLKSSYFLEERRFAAHVNSVSLAVNIAFMQRLVSFLYILFKVNEIKWFP